MNYDYLFSQGVHVEAHHGGESCNAIVKVIDVRHDHRSKADEKEQEQEQKSCPKNHFGRST